MDELLAWLEASSLGHAIRGAGVRAYSFTNLFHILGIATLFGSILILDLRLLGVWRRVPLATLAAPTVTLAAVGFAIAAASGLCMLATNASEYVGNPFLLVKFSAIAVGLLNALALSFVPAWRQRAAREPDVTQRRQLAVFGGVSLVAWLSALVAGRMIAYY